MNDRDELLREDGQAWQPAAVAAPDVDAALARAAARRSRLASAATLVVVVGLAAGGVLVANQFSPGTPATPAPLATGPSAPDVPKPTPSAAPAGLAELTDAVHHNATQFGVPATASAVSTTWVKAQEFLPASGDQPTAGDTAVWLVEVTGEFSCDTCQTTQQGPERSVSTLTMALTADGLHQIWYELGDVTRPLPELGTVLTLDPDGSTGNLSFTRAVHDQGTRFGIPVTGEAVLTTWQKAQEFLGFTVDQAPGQPAGDGEVWVVQLHGAFSCDDCQTGQTGPEQSVSTLILVLDAATFELHDAEPGNTPRRLDQLGIVQAVDLELVG
ncbi:MAG: hypothetical protein VB093_09270 [Propionicimonas sp.]|nr:hypothetical protein [Propionicimonas sp.]